MAKEKKNPPIGRIGVFAGGPKTLVVGMLAKNPESDRPSERFAVPLFEVRPRGRDIEGVTVDLEEIVRIYNSAADASGEKDEAMRKALEALLTAEYAMPVRGYGQCCRECDVLEGEGHLNECNIGSAIKLLRAALTTKEQA